MHKSKTPIGFWSAVSMGIGAMVGAGIFALLGEAGSISGSAVYISFIIGGIIALFSGYSLGKLGAAYPSSGGIIEYLSQSYGTGLFTGTMGIMMYFAAIASLSLVAKTFGNYAITFLPNSEAESLIWNHIFATGIIILFVLINLRGAGDVVIWEQITVGIKFFVLAAMSVGGLFYIQPALIAPATYPPVTSIFFSLSITFFAFEGFRVISNTAEDMSNPSRTLPRAMMASILLVMFLYVAIAFAVFGNLPSENIIESKDFALAEAALPIFGQAGFTMIAVTALIATASAINANLYAVTNVTYQLAKDGELPSAFIKPIAHSRQGLVISGALIIVLSLLFDLSEIAAIGSIAILFIHGITHIGHLRLLNITGASKPLVLLATLFSFAAMSLALFYVAKENQEVLTALAIFLIASTLSELALRKFAGKKVVKRI